MKAVRAIRPNFREGLYSRRPRWHATPIQIFPPVFTTRASAIVNHFASNGCKSTDVFERGKPHNASARGKPAVRFPQSTRRMSIRKIQNGGSVIFRQYLRAEHQRREIERFHFGRATSRLSVSGACDIGVGEPESPGPSDRKCP